MDLTQLFKIWPEKVHQAHHFALGRSHEGSADLVSPLHAGDGGAELLQGGEDAGNDGAQLAAAGGAGSPAFLHQLCD